MHSTRINDHEFIDLGLPSGVKWASCNIGADSPEEYGDYFAWGETESKDEYTSGNSLTFATQISDIKFNTIVVVRGKYVDNCIRVANIGEHPKYDVARNKWGGTWRMPTYEDIAELITECNSEWVEQNGVNGRRFTGPNGKAIFMPAAGSYIGDELGLEGENGFYLTSMCPDNNHDCWGRNHYSYNIEFGSEYQRINYVIRYYGCSVRPVAE